jgi:hypothetical protein
VKKAEAPKQALASVAPKGLGLADYGSDSD